MTACGWFWGSHGCDAEEGHAPLPTEDGGHCAHRCGLLDERDEEGTLCSEIRQSDGEWVIRHWYSATADEAGEWGRWATYSEPFRMEDAEVGQFVVSASAPCYGCQCESEHDGDYGSAGHAGPCPPHTCKPRGVAIEHSIQDPFTGETTVGVRL